MRNLIILLFLSFNTFAAEDEIRISYQVSKNQELNQVVFFVKPSSIIKWQNSNVFSSVDDVKLGKMQVSPLTEVKETYSRLKIILAHFDEMDRKMKKVNKGWNDLVENPGPHATIVYINKFKIPSDSTYSKEIGEMMQKLLNQKTSLIEGVELVKTNKEIQHYKNSKIIKTDSFLHPFYCEKSGDKHQLCHIKNWGSLRISI